MNEALSQKNWFVPARLASYIIIASVVVIWMGYPAYLNLQFILYSLFTLGFTLCIAFSRKISLPSLVRSLIFLQFMLEISLESGIIFVTGNIHSSFSALFLLTIVSASLVYRLVGTLMIASVVSAAYTFIIWLGTSPPSGSAVSMETLKTLLLTDESAFYSIFLHILIFYLVAFIAGYLAERLRLQGEALEDTSRALRLARLETDDILRHLNSGLLTIDASGSIIYFNRAAERILDYREEEVRGLLCQEVFSERMPALADNLLACLAGSQNQSRTEIEVLDSDCETIPIGLSCSLLTGSQQTPRGVIGIFTDLTEAKKLEEKVRAADRQSAVGEMSASMAHEIRNPLAAISGSVELLIKELDLTDENARLMDLIIKESNRLNKILTEFLSYARIGRPAYDKIELYHLVSDVIELLRHHPLMNSGISVRMESSRSYVYVVGDENLVKQLVVNLAYNACEALAGKPGEITFRIIVMPKSDQILLQVADNGPGISPEKLGKIYEPFYSTKKQGTGLGLAIVHRACHLLKLELTVESNLGLGTTFNVLFSDYTRQGAAANQSALQGSTSDQPLPRFV